MGLAVGQAAAAGERSVRPREARAPRGGGGAGALGRRSPLRSPSHTD